MKLVFGFLLISLACASQIEPIPPTLDGYYRGPDRTNYTLELFMDHLCSDCKHAWSGLEAYYKANSAWLQMIIHQVPLPYHTYSFIVTTAGRYVQLNSPDNFTQFIEYMFDHQDFYLQQTKVMNLNQIYTYLASDTQTATGVAQGNVLSALEGKVYDNDVWVSWRYGLSRGVVGTPTYIVNGIQVPDASSYETEQDWETFFKALNQ